MPKPKGLYNAGAPAQESDQSQTQEVRSAQLSRIHLRKGDSQKINSVSFHVILR